MAAHVANVRVREVGTLGGNLCFAEPHADPGTLLLVYDASVALARQGGTRTLAIEQFFVGPFEVALADDEILTAIRVPALPAHTAAAYLKYGLLERPSVGVAVAVTALPDQVQEVRAAVGCVGPTPRRLRDVEGLLSQKELAEVRATLDAAGALAGSAADAVTDLRVLRAQVVEEAALPLADAIDGRGSLDYRVKPLDPDNAAFVGPAITAFAYPADVAAVFGAPSSRS